MYATEADLGAYFTQAGKTPPTNAAFLLKRASTAVDRMLMASVYPVDASGSPTTTAHIAALNEATCAQAFYASVLGDPSGALGNFSSFSIGSISASRRAGSGSGSGSETPWYSSDARDILTVAGLLPGDIQDGGSTGGDWLKRP